MPASNYSIRLWYVILQLENSVRQRKVRHHRQAGWHLSDTLEARKLLSDQVPGEVCTTAPADQGQGRKGEKLSQKDRKCIFVIKHRSTMPPITFSSAKASTKPSRLKP